MRNCVNPTKVKWNPNGSLNFPHNNVEVVYPSSAPLSAKPGEQNGPQGDQDSSLPFFDNTVVPVIHLLYLTLSLQLQDPEPLITQLPGLLQPGQVPN